MKMYQLGKVYSPIQGSLGNTVKKKLQKPINYFLEKTTSDHISVDEAKHKPHDAQKLMVFLI